MKQYDEGLGTVYERFMLQRFFESLLDANSIKTVLEVPLYGMTGISGINSAYFAERGCEVTLMDSSTEVVTGAFEAWQDIPWEKRPRIMHHQDIAALPFGSDSYDLVWNFAALWHLGDARGLLSEMARTSAQFVLIFVPNRRQIGYFLRKHVFDRGFFSDVHEEWNDAAEIIEFLQSFGFELREQGVLDVPPWPDTAFPIKKLFSRNSSINRKSTTDFWTWDIISYYSGKDPTLQKRVEKYTVLEDLPIPWRLKLPWAHHRYVLLAKNT